MDKPFQVMPGVHVLPSFHPIPGFGHLAVNAFVIEAKEPVLVDTGMGNETVAFLEALEEVIDPRDIRWIWLTHDDADHVGSLREVLDAAPDATLVTNSLAALRMSTMWQVPMDRVRWLNPGQSLSVGDRELTAIRPPIFDNPTTIAVYDNASKAFFSADLFGGILAAPVKDAAEVAEDALPQGVAGWASLDSPWVHMVDLGAFERALEGVRRLEPSMVLSAHLPPASGMADRLLDILAGVPASPPAVTPDQAALEMMLSMARGGD